MLKISAFYLEKQKSFISKKNTRKAKSDLALISKQPALFTVLIFSDGFGLQKHEKNSFDYKIEKSKWGKTCWMHVPREFKLSLLRN